ncbi:MAG: hypothetical protein LQ342_000014 [Letrouitia transgressa]|nr:MAG: hypothetical protein LQ342_000014 [Letrouitia transgressa]
MSPHFSSSARTRTPIDVLALNMAYGLDVVSAFTFGIPQGTNFIHDVHARNYWFGTYLKAFPSDYMFWLLYAPGLRKWAHRIGITIAPDWIGEARRNLEQWTLQIVDNTEEALRKRSVEDMPDGDVPIVYNQLKLAHAKERYAKGADLALAPPSEERLQIASECLDHLIATRDVFGPSTSHLPTATELESLPLLNAMIKESLRLRGTLPTPNPRVTPLDKITTIGPYESIPGGIRISSFAWCLHRNEKVFPDCENWRPERWLGELGDLGEQERWFWTFGSGSRMCVGDSLAIEMIRYAVALVFTNFHTSVIVSEGFGKDRQWVIGKPDEKLVLQFNEIHAEKA